ncbi:ribonuclease HII [Filibacter tadaridae]|uniref:ribonuclease HII n=1 Tax=Filibacter tadaridae TaxID=2483811 RepID=UPI000F54C430|nr:ribonuclease HII [Filibacter tadaridae]
MKTVKEIIEMLAAVDEPGQWMEELAADKRAGVKNALERWSRRYDKRMKIQAMHVSKMAFDTSFAPFEGALVAGVDEAGRGPLAGPVVTATVILPQDVQKLIGLDDSKRIAKRDRERLAVLIKEIATDYNVHVQSAKQIDDMNIYAATRDSMEQAVRALTIRPDFVMVDAMALATDCPTASIVKGDAQSLVIAAASILAKTTRDAIMDDLHKEFPAYQFNKNAGYGTPGHLDALQQYGPCEHHRKSFEPVKSMILEKREIT